MRLIIGKGGLFAASAKAFSDMGGAYLAIIGGTAALETTWIEQIEEVDLDDLNPESLWKFRIRGFGRCWLPWTRMAAVSTRLSTKRQRANAPVCWRHWASRAEHENHQDRYPDPRVGRRRAVRRPPRPPTQSCAVDHGCREGPAGQERVHAHGAGWLQRGTGRR